MENSLTVRHFSIFFSAAVCALSFLLPSYFSWGIFVFLVPVFYYAINNKLTLKDGFSWGIIFNSLFYSGLFFLLQEYASISHAWIGLILFILYCSIFSAVWFFAISFFQMNLTFACINLLFFTVLFWYWADQMTFFIFGRFEGNPLLNVFIPFMNNSMILLSLRYLPERILFLFLCIFQLTIALSIYLKNYKQSFFLLSALMSLSPFFLNSRRKKMPYIDLRKIVTLIPSGRTVWERALDIDKKIGDIVKHFPQAQIICCPESSFIYPLNRYPEIISLWTGEIDRNHIVLILGGHRTQETLLYNSIFCLSRGRIIHYYDKKHLMILSEKIEKKGILPSLLSSFFLKNSKPFSEGKIWKEKWLLSTCEIEPFICSELFFSFSRPPLSNSIILCLVNDSWFCSYIQYLLFLCARYKALIWQKDIIYCGYAFQAYIQMDGSFYYLKSF